MLGAVAQATERAELMTYVTCPTMRYHPAVVAQKAATLALLTTAGSPSGWAPGRTSTSTSSGQAGPTRTSARRCSSEAVEIIRALLDGGYVNYEGAHFRVDAARIWDLPDRPVPHRRRGVRDGSRVSCSRRWPT